MKDNTTHLKEFLDHQRLLNRSPLTIRQYQADLKKFFLWLEFTRKKSPFRTRRSDIDLYFQFLINGGEIEQTTGVFRKTKKILLEQPPLKVSSRKRHLSSLSQFFRFHIEKNRDSWWRPFRLKRSPIIPSYHSIKLKQADISPTIPFYRSDLELVKGKVLHPKDEFLFDLIFLGGLRIAEAAVLKLKDLNFERKTINLIRKGGKRQTLYLEELPTLKRSFARYLNWNQYLVSEEDYLFRSKMGTKPSTRGLRQRMRKLTERFEMNGKSPHGLRKGRATELYSKKKDLLYVRDFLGHQDAKVTQTYIETAGRQ